MHDPGLDSGPETKFVNTHKWRERYQRDKK